MAKKDNIVTFEEARRSSKRRRSAADDSGAQHTVAITGSSPSSKGGKSVKGMRRRSSSLPTSGVDRTQAEERQRTSSAKRAQRKQAKADAKRRRGKARADRKFTKMYGGAQSAPTPSEGAPRAAVYEAKMGSKHRKAAHALQQKAAEGLSAASGFIGGLSLSLPDFTKLPKRTMRILMVIGCCAFLTFMLYAPAQQCYQQMRERDRAAAEYAAVLDRNKALADSVDTLQSDAGIEDKAHAEYGMVKEGEEAGSVTGIDVESSTDFVANVVPGAVPAPDTWYSGVLDFLFGYSNPR